jgi:hypothetical protein
MVEEWWNGGGMVEWRNGGMVEEDNGERILMEWDEPSN